MLRRFLRAHDVRADDSWRLLRWCVEHGASDFTLALMRIEGEAPTFLDEVSAALKPFAAAPAVRNGEHTAEVWTLTPASVAVLQDLLPDGLFTAASYAGSGWLEDPTFYRAGEVMLGIVTHENEGVLVVQQADHASFEALGLISHDTAEWI